MPTTLPSDSYVIAVDAGGTHTRAACFALDGERIGGATGAAGAWHHDEDAVAHVQRTVAEALHSGDLPSDGAVALVAGVAGISRRGGDHGDRSLQWAHDQYALPSLSCDQVFVNDAVTAHRGALLGGPGIVVVAGTGSMILAITADGTEIENGQFAHYAGGARHLAFSAVQEILLGNVGLDDADLLAGIFAAWEVVDVEGLRAGVLRLESTGQQAVNRHYGALAPLITAAATASPLADAAVCALAEQTARGVLLLVPLAGREPVRVTWTGALASTPAFTERLEAALAAQAGARTVMAPPASDAVAGAALMALQRVGCKASSAFLDRLRAPGRC